MTEEDSWKSACTHTQAHTSSHTHIHLFLEVSTGHFSSLLAHFCSLIPLSCSRGPAGGAFALLTRACPGNTSREMQMLQRGAAHPERLAIHMKMEHFRYLMKPVLPRLDACSSVQTCPNVFFSVPYRKMMSSYRTHLKMGLGLGLDKGKGNETGRGETENKVWL